jgi:hypothetical protein
MNYVVIRENLMKFNVSMIAAALACCVAATPASAITPAPASSGQIAVDTSLLLSDDQGGGIGYAATSDFTLPTGFGNFTLTVLTESASALDSMNLFLKTGQGPLDYSLVSGLVGSRSADLKTMTYTHSSLAAGTYSADIFGTLGSTVKVTASYGTITSVPEAQTTALFLAGAGVAAFAVRRRRA